MTGVSTGPKSFNMQMVGTDNKGITVGTLNPPVGWDLHLLGTNFLIYQERKLDLRAYNQGGKGLDIRGLALQESLSWECRTTENDNPPYTFCIDILSSVRLSRNSIAAMHPDGGVGGEKYHFLPGFLASPSSFDSPDDQVLNSTQVVWGMWRRFIQNQMLPYDTPNRFFANVTIDSGEFGSGETLVAPNAYWTRVVFWMHDATTVNVPSANLEIGALTLDLKPYVELNQMARMGQR